MVVGEHRHLPERLARAEDRVGDDVALRSGPARDDTALLDEVDRLGQVPLVEEGLALDVTVTVGPSEHQPLV